MDRQFGALSGLAILLIVLNHSISLGVGMPTQFGYTVIEGIGRNILSFLEALGAFAVPIFLFISGSFVAYAARGLPQMGSRKFVWSSIQHILWPYLIWSIIFYIVVYIQFGEQYSPLEYIKNLLIGYPYHFVPLLLFNYLLSPLLVMIARRYAILLTILVASYQLLIISIVHPAILGFSLPDWSRILAPPVIAATLANWAIYFPLGIVYGLHSKIIKPWSIKFKWFLLGLTVLFFLGGILYYKSVLNTPIFPYLAPFTFILFTPAITRNSIPKVKSFERIGRRSYGIYLTHLIVLSLSIGMIRIFLPVLFNFPLLYLPLLFILGIQVPLRLMESVARTPFKKAYRFVFG